VQIKRNIDEVLPLKSRVRYFWATVYENDEIIVALTICIAEENIYMLLPKKTNKTWLKTKLQTHVVTNIVKNTSDRKQVICHRYLRGRYTWLPGRKWNPWNKVPASAAPDRRRRPYSASCRSTSGRKRSARRRRSLWPRDDRKRSARTASDRTAHAPLGWRQWADTWRWSVPTDSSPSCRRRRRSTLDATRQQNGVWIMCLCCQQYVSLVEQCARESSLLLRKWCRRDSFSWYSQ